MERQAQPKEGRTLAISTFTRSGCGGACVADGEPGAEQLRSELLSFRAGKYDDQVDALGLIGRQLDVMVTGTRPTPDVPVQRDRYRRRWRDEEEDAVNWKGGLGSRRR
jgi:hypothetical protein